MLQALAAPLFKSIALAGIVFGLTATQLARDDQPVTRRLVLHAPERPDAIYLSAFHNDALTMTFEGAELHPVTFEIRANLFDGCRWLATETLVPLDHETFSYDYRETILGCDPGSEPLLKTPRTGIVTVAK